MMANRPLTAKQRERCRHRTTWIISSHGEWCWGCGAYRALRPVSPVGCAVASDWAYPGQVNPWDRFSRSMERRAIRRTEREKQR